MYTTYMKEENIGYTGVKVAIIGDWNPTASFIGVALNLWDMSQVPYLSLEDFSLCYLYLSYLLVVVGSAHTMTTCGGQGATS